MTKVSMIGLDLAKNVFQAHGVDVGGKVVVRRQLRRPQVEKFLGTLLTVGATSHLRYERARDIKDPWLQALLARRPFKVAAVAYGAKMARIIWAMLVTGEHYRAPNRRHSGSVQAAA
jgi:transposase